MHPQHLLVMIITVSLYLEDGEQKYHQVRMLLYNLFSSVNSENGSVPWENNAVQ
jgi:hypothetical protein